MIILCQIRSTSSARFRVRFCTMQNVRSKRLNSSLVMGVVNLLMAFVENDNLTVQVDLHRGANPRVHEIIVWTENQLRVHGKISGHEVRTDLDRQMAKKDSNNKQYLKHHFFPSFKVINQKKFQISLLHFFVYQVLQDIKINSTRKGAILWSKRFLPLMVDSWKCQKSFAFTSGFFSEWSLSIEEMWKTLRKSNKVLLSELKLIKRWENRQIPPCDVTDNGDRGFDSRWSHFFRFFFRVFYFSRTANRQIRPNTAQYGPIWHHSSYVWFQLEKMSNST